MQFTTQSVQFNVEFCLYGHKMYSHQHNLIWEYFRQSILKETLYLLAVDAWSHLMPLPSLNWVNLFSAPRIGLFPWIDLFYIFHINGLIEYVPFCDLLSHVGCCFQGSSNGIVCIRTSFLLIVEQHNIPLYGCTIFCLSIHQFGLFPLFGYYEKCCFEYSWG